ncbi:hypothetical protein A9500_05350 [Haemophilus sp. CCUG 60358]|jgi:raw score 3.48|uniref:FRG domain-containing protein n=1 Tax=Haemophilus sp. CCUG 60358 TaxID=1859695 RepID=UPI000802DCAE|nr:FRG domain-containing protein [Haemophilus sp. CCUG 60358]OBX90320.1 hypothetical protein A9500_05350 [Haemophilus sp. CCUG 60358]
MEIKSIKDLIDALEQLGEPKDGYTRFFRGHSNAEKYKLEPSIYREDNKYYHNEDNIIRDAIINNPDEFSDKDTLFDTLVKLQHYGYPTRLLDLTSNLLVAAYFAVRNPDEKGEIIIFDIPNNDIKYFDSDTVSVLSAISLRKSDFSINIDETILKAQSLCAQADFLLSVTPTSGFTESALFFKNAVKKNIKYQSNISFGEEDINKLEKEIEEIISKMQNKDKKENYEMSLATIKEESNTECFNRSTEISKLLHDIRKDKPEFRPIINKEDLERVICVKPKLNNKRIIRQQGCFLLFGINKIKTSQAKLNEKWIKKDQNNENFIIPADRKQHILDELKIFGISQNSLFPELESQAKEILEKYKKYKK